MMHLSEEMDAVDALLDAINSQADKLGDKLRMFLDESRQERLAAEQLAEDDTQDADAKTETPAADE